MTRRSASDTPRVDGPLKVTGTRPVHLRLRLPGPALCRAGRGDDRQRHGRQRSTSAAPEQMPGVRAVFKRGELGPIDRASRQLPDASIPGRDAAAVRGRRGALLRPVRRARGGRHVRGRPRRRPTRSRSPTPPNRRTSTRTSIAEQGQGRTASAATPTRPSPKRAGQDRPDLRHARRRTTRSSRTRPWPSGTATS